MTPVTWNQYRVWLRECVRAFKRGDVRVMSPMLNPLGDPIHVHADRSSGKLVVHDNGETLVALRDLGVPDAEQRILSAAGRIARYQQGRIEADCLPVGDAVHFVMCSIWQSFYPE